MHSGVGTKPGCWLQQWLLAAGMANVYLVALALPTPASELRHRAALTGEWGRGRARESKQQREGREGQYWRTCSTGKRGTGGQQPRHCGAGHLRVTTVVGEQLHHVAGGGLDRTFVGGDTGWLRGRRGASGAWHWSLGFPSQLCCVPSGQTLLLLACNPLKLLLTHGYSIRAPGLAAASWTVT